MILVSSCLIGLNCRYNCLPIEDKGVLEYLKDKNFIPICPEQIGGLSTPRLPSEIQNGSGQDVIDKRALVKNTNGIDVTEEFLKGAYEVLKLTELYDIEYAIMKSRSPSCGLGSIYDGTFNKKIIKGDGVCTALLKKHNIKVITEEEI